MFIKVLSYGFYLYGMISCVDIYMYLLPLLKYTKRDRLSNARPIS